jgi:hypothetical protein
MPDNRMKPVAIEEAKRLANECGFTRLLILGIDDNDNFAFTTFGRSKKQCQAMKEWADHRVPQIGLLMHRETQ